MTLYIMCGVPGCGKSSWLKEMADMHFLDNCAVVSRDEIRFSMLEKNDKYFSKEKKVFKKFCAVIGTELGYRDTFADATHLTPASRQKLLNGISEYVDLNDIEICGVYFTKERCERDCLRQNAERKGLRKVPEEEVKKMLNAYVEPTLEEGFTRFIEIGV